MRGISARLKNAVLRLRGEVSTQRLVERGLTVGKNFNRRQGCIIDYSHCWLITIGNNVTFAPRVHVLAHDGSTKSVVGYTRIGLVAIGDNVFVGAESIILPGVSIGSGAIIAAGSVVTKDVPPHMVVGGDPAHVLMSVDEFKAKHEAKIEESTALFDSSWHRNDLPEEKRKMMITRLEDNGGIGYIE